MSRESDSTVVEHSSIIVGENIITPSLTVTNLGVVLDRIIMLLLLLFCRYVCMYFLAALVLVCV